MDKIWNYAFIYVINFPNEKRYIGRWTQNFNKLLLRYSKTYNEDRYVERAIIKYGFENIKIEIIEEFHSISNDDLNNKEIEWISFFDATDQSKGYNIKPGGAGSPMPINGRKAISDKAKLRLSNKNNHPNYGNKYSKESCEKISMALKGKYCGENNKNWKGYLDKDALTDLIKKNKTFIEISKELIAGQDKIERSLLLHFGEKSLRKIRDLFCYPDKEIFEKLLIKNTVRSFAKIGYHQGFLQKCLLYYYGTTSISQAKHKLGLHKCNWQKFNSIMIEKLKNEIKDNFVFLSDENKIVERNSKIQIKCPKNHISNIKLVHWINGTRCHQCVIDDIYNKKIDKLKLEIEKEFYKLIHADKNNDKDKARIIYCCPNGHIREVTWKGWENGQRCGKCALNKKHENLREKRKHTINETFKDLEKRMKLENYILLPNQIYKNSTTKLDYICPNGHKKSLTRNSWIGGHRCVHCTHKSKKINSKEEA